MTKQVELAVSPRAMTGKSAKKLRRMGLIPANIFGHGETSQAVQLTGVDFEGLRRGHHTTGVISLRIDGTPQAQTALIRHVQRDPISGKIVHIDFLRVSLRDRITTRMPLHFEGTAPAVKVEGGVLLHLIEALEVECAAGEIADSLTVDITTLAHIDDTLHAKDIPLPPHYTLLTDPDEAVVKVTAPRIEKVEEVEAAPAATAEAAPAAKTAEGEGTKE